jgi:hypothetical protein
MEPDFELVPALGETAGLMSSFTNSMRRRAIFCKMRFRSHGAPYGFASNEHMIPFVRSESCDKKIGNLLAMVDGWDLRDSSHEWF